MRTDSPSVMQLVWHGLSVVVAVALWLLFLPVIAPLWVVGFCAHRWTPWKFSDTDTDAEYTMADLYW